MMKDRRVCGRLVVPLVFLALAFAMLPTGARAGGAEFPCTHPLVYSGGNVNTYVKQFEGLSDPEATLDETSKMLSQMIVFDGLNAQMGFGPLGFIQLVPEPGEPMCPNADILKRVLTGDGATGMIEKGKAVMIFSGRFEAVGEEVFLFTEVEFLRKGVEETVDVPLPGGLSGDVPFTGTLPGTRASFTPRRLTKQQIHDIAKAFDRYLVVRGRPSESSSGARFDAIHGATSFSIVDRQPGWLKIQSRTGPSGWVQVPEDVGATGLRAILPELYFVDAAAIYLQTRVAGESLTPRQFARHVQAFAERVKTFEKSAGRGGDLQALGLLYAMDGMLRLLRDVDRESAAVARRKFAGAAKLLPTNADAQTLAAISDFAGEAWEGIPDGDPGSVEFEAIASKRAQQLQRSLLQALDIDPTNVYAKVNLEKLFMLRDASPDKTWLKEPVVRFREQLQKNPEVVGKVGKK